MNNEKALNGLIELSGISLESIRDLKKFADQENYYSGDLVLVIPMPRLFGMKVEFSEKVLTTQIEVRPLKQPLIAPHWPIK